jgi:hypothetical protein
VPRLSFGLPALAVAGNKIVNAQTGRAVLLRGVNRSGFEYSSPEGVGALTKTGINEAEISQIVDVWGANIIRLPFNQDWALERQGYDPAPYRADLEAVIAMAARRGAYTLVASRTSSLHFRIQIQFGYGSSSRRRGVMSRRSCMTSSTNLTMRCRMTPCHSWGSRRMDRHFLSERAR